MMYRMFSLFLLFAVVLISGCSGESSNYRSTQDHKTAAAAAQAEAYGVQSAVMRMQEPSGETVNTNLAILRPGEVWEQTFSFILPIKTYSINRSSGSSDFVYRNFRIQLAENAWSDCGVGAWVVSSRASEYSFDFWKLENDTGFIIPECDDPTVGIEELGKLSRNNFVKMKWRDDPEDSGFSLTWDLRRGRGFAHRATVTVKIAVPDGDTWQAAIRRQGGGTIHFGSEYKDVGIVVCLRYDSYKERFVISPGPCYGGELISNPHVDGFNQIF